MDQSEQLALELETRTAWNPRYVAFCAEHGREPEAQLAHDREQFPGGCMCDFILWIDARWRAWRKAMQIDPHAPLTNEYHAAFDRWLSGRGWTLL